MAWGSVCRDFNINVNTTQSIPGNFNMENYTFNILRYLEDRQILISGEYEMAVRFCEPPAGINRKDTIQLLVHGATFNKIMWDFPYKPEVYSWTRLMTTNGYSTLAVDLIGRWFLKFWFGCIALIIRRLILGSGNSSHPHGLLEVQTEAHVQTIHQVIQQIRSGELLGKSWARIALVGFSIGGITANAVADRFPKDADLLVLLGIGWNLTYVYPAFLSGLQSPANAINAAQWGNLSDFYQTQPTRAARQVANFFGSFEEGSLDMDYSTRDVDSLGLAITYTFHLVTAPAYDGPVFLGVGDNDTSFCGTSCGIKPYELYVRFPQASEHIIKVYENTGHALLYHRASGQVQKDCLDFLDRHS